MEEQGEQEGKEAGEMHLEDFEAAKTRHKRARTCSEDISSNYAFRHGSHQKDAARGSCAKHSLGIRGGALRAQPMLATGDGKRDSSALFQNFLAQNALLHSLSLLRRQMTCTSGMDYH